MTRHCEACGEEITDEEYDSMSSHAATTFGAEYHYHPDCCPVCNRSDCKACSYPIVDGTPTTLTSGGIIHATHDGCKEAIRLAREETQDARRSALGTGGVY